MTIIVNIFLFLALFKNATTWPSDIKRYIWHAHKDCFLELATVSHTRHPSFRKLGHKNDCNKLNNRLLAFGGGGPRVVVSTAAFHARVRGSVPNLGGLKETKNVSSLSTCESQYCGEPPWSIGSVLGLRPPGLEFRILCLEDSVISINSRSSGGSPGPV